MADVDVIKQRCCRRLSSVTTYCQNKSCSLRTVSLLSFHDVRYNFVYVYHHFVYYIHNVNIKALTHIQTWV